MDIRENESLKGKTTMRIGGTARYFAELTKREDVKQAFLFADDKKIPLLVLGGGSNTIFADGTINALVVRVKADNVAVDGSRVRAEAGKNLPLLINELAVQGLDLSPLTGILGTVGGAVFGNAGQGAHGTWIDHYVRSVSYFWNGAWRAMDNAAIHFGYRDSKFKHISPPPLIWEVLMDVPHGQREEVQAEVQRLLKYRIETQPHVKTAGSCFTAKQGVPAWQLIDKAGLRGFTIGDVEIAQKHANFLLNKGSATFADAAKLVEHVQETIGELDVEMRFIGEDGTCAF